jgi:hypothetical membrane protein
MKPKDHDVPRIAGWCGIASPVVALACVFAAASISPWFSWTSNYISDLGGYPGERPIWSVHGAASVLLDVGLMVGGALGMMFASGLRGTKGLGTSCGRLGSFLFLIDMLAMTCVGIFPESTGGPHGVSAVAYFVLIPLSLFLMGISFRETSYDKRFGVMALLLGLVSFFSFPLFALPRPYRANAIVELVPSTCIAVFSIAFGYRLTAEIRSGSMAQTTLIRPESRNDGQ